MALISGVICLDRQVNNTLPVISEVYHCNYYCIIKCDIMFKKDNTEQQILAFCLLLEMLKLDLTNFGMRNTNVRSE